MSFTILGTGSALPGRIVTNEELTCMVDTSEFISNAGQWAPNRACNAQANDGST